MLPELPELTLCHLCWSCHALFSALQHQQYPNLAYASCQTKQKTKSMVVCTDVSSRVIATSCTWHTSAPIRRRVVHACLSPFASTKAQIKHLLKSSLSAKATHTQEGARSNNPADSHTCAHTCHRTASPQLGVAQHLITASLLLAALHVAKSTSCIRC